MITILDAAKHDGAKEENGIINGGEFIRLGYPLLSGCQYCGATLGPYNAFPSKTGYIQCGQCVGNMGFETVEEFKEFETGDE